VEPPSAITIVEKQILASRFGRSNLLEASTNIVNALLLRREMVLLAKRSIGRKAYPGCWSFPGGHVEKGETLSDALSRELREEVGVKPLVCKRIGSITDPNPEPNQRVIYHMYAITAWEGEPSAVGDEHSELQWFTVDAACGLEGLALFEYVADLRRLRTIGLLHSK
jgi:mutator protein MutT